MTDIQCAERQAARDNLVQELALMLEQMANHWWGSDDTYDEAMALVARAKEQQ